VGHRFTAAIKITARRTRKGTALAVPNDVPCAMSFRTLALASVRSLLLGVMTKLRVLTDRISGAINQPPHSSQDRLEWATREARPQNQRAQHGQDRSR
jgi:hypothetical protein